MKNEYVGKEMNIREKLEWKVGAKVQAVSSEVITLRVQENMEHIELLSSDIGSADWYNHFVR